MNKPDQPGSQGAAGSSRPDREGGNQGRSEEARDPNRPLKLDENGNPIPEVDADGNPTGEFEKEGLGRRGDKGTTDTAADAEDTEAGQ